MDKKKDTKRPRYLPFKEARNYVYSLQLKGRNEWKVFCKSGKRPENIPAVPDLFYSEFISYEDWTGGTKRPVYRNYTEAREFARSLKLKNWSEWIVFAKSKKKPHDIPVYPYHTYRSQFLSLGDWLDTNPIHWRYQTWRPFLEARIYVHNLKLKGQIGWKEFCKSGLRPQDIPAAPERHYSEWKSWEDWTGVRSRKSFRPFEEARAFAHSLGLGSPKEWNEYASSGKRPKDIPTVPRKTYKDKWISHEDWLGEMHIQKQRCGRDLPKQKT